MSTKQLTAQLKQLLAGHEQMRGEVARLRDDLQSLRSENESLKAAYAELERKHTALQHDYEALLASSQALIADRDRLQRRVNELEAANAKLTDMLWGRRSERRVENGQLHLWNEHALPPSEDERAVIMAQEQAHQAADEELLRQFEARRKRSTDRRSESLPDHLERRERVLDLSEEEKVGLERIGDAVTERLRFEKPYLYVERIVRPKYVVAGDRDAGVLAAPPPLAIVEGSKYDFSVIAAVVTDKFAFHLTTYREQDLLAACGWAPSRSTLNELINQACETIRPLFAQLQCQIMQQPIVLADDTQVRLLTRGALSEVDLELLGRRRAGRLRGGGKDPPQPDTGDPGSVASFAWLYAGLDDGAPYNIFHWSLTREHATVDRHLKDFRGTLVGDAFGGNARIAARSADRIRFAACNVHARREFLDCERDEPLLAAQALSLYRQLYDVEERGKGLDADSRQALREREAEPVWQRLRNWLDQVPPERALPKSRLGQALTYLRNHWDALRVYLTDGRLPIDNSQSERTIRPLTIGRKNWVFLGHPAAAVGRMQLLSIVSSAHRHHLVVQDYLESALQELAYGQQHCPDELEIGSERLLRLLPDHWALEHPASVRNFRREEQTERSEMARVRRARRRQLERARAKSAT